MVRLFAVYAAITFLPVLALGVVLAVTVRSDADQRALAKGRSEATLIAQTAVQPQLAGGCLERRSQRGGARRSGRLVDRAVRKGDVLRLRLRDLAGRVVFSDDGSGLRAGPEEEALDCRPWQGGDPADPSELRRQRSRDVMVSLRWRHLPLTEGTPARRVGVLEIYLPFAPIARDATAGLHRLYLDLALGLTALYLLLFGITVSVSRGLRREVAINAFLAHHEH